MTVVMDGSDTSANLQTVNLDDETIYTRHTVTPYVLSAQVVSVYGTSGVDASGNLIKETGTLTGSVSLNIRSMDSDQWSMLSSFNAGTVIHFTLGGSDEQPVTYRTRVHKPSLDLRADGIVATYFFVNAEVYDVTLAGSSSSYLKVSPSQLSSASNTFKIVYSTKSAKEQEADLKAQLGMGGTGNRGKVTPNAPKRIPRKPHEVFAEIAALCKWNTTGTFGGTRHCSTVEESDVLIASDIAWHYETDFYRWVGRDLASVCITNRNTGYNFFFGTDDHGTTVAHFHSTNYDVRTGTVVSASDQTLPIIEYGGGRGGSGVIQCHVDADLLSAALLQAGRFCGSSAVDKDAAYSLPNERRLSAAGYGSSSGSLLDVGVADVLNKTVAGRSPEEVKALAIHYTTPEATGLLMTLSLVGTGKYLVGSFFRFMYYLPDGKYLPIVSNVPYQVQSATHQITEQGYTTTIEALAMSLPARVSDMSVTIAAEVAAEKAAVDKAVANGQPIAPNLITGGARPLDLIPGTNTPSFDQPPVLGENVFDSSLAYRKSARYRETHMPKQVTVAPATYSPDAASETPEDGE